MSEHTFDAAGVCVHCQKDSMSGGLGGECHAVPHDLTQTEVALARVLSAIDVWLRPGHDDDSPEANALRRACAPFVNIGLMYAATGRLTERSRALIDRAKKAGIL